MTDSEERAFTHGAADKLPQRREGRGELDENGTSYSFRVFLNSFEMFTYGEVIKAKHDVIMTLSAAVCAASVCSYSSFRAVLSSPECH